MSKNRIGVYDLIRRIGRGGMGEVWLARDTTLRRSVAIKLLPTRTLDNPTAARRFLREARTAAQLNHPNGVTIYQVGEEDGQFYIAMELIEGGSLADEIRERGALPWLEATRAVRDAAAGLAAAHEAGLVHRDIKPSNLMRSGNRASGNGFVKVVDFGLARANADSVQVTRSGAILGSPAYLSPEQGRGEKADARSDLYSLACTYYVLLTGQIPFAGDNTTAVIFQHIHKPCPNPRELVLDLPTMVCEIVKRGMQKSPADRYQTAAEMIADLDEVMAAPRLQSDAPFWRWKVAWILALAAVFIVIGVTFAAFRSRANTGNASVAANAGHDNSSVQKSPTTSQAAAATTEMQSVATNVVSSSAPIPASVGSVASAPMPPAEVVAAPTTAAPTTAAPATAAQTTVAPTTAAVVKTDDPDKPVEDMHRQIDLLKLIDPSADAVDGSWVFDSGALSGTRTSKRFVNIEIPYVPPAEYDFRTVFTPTTPQRPGVGLLCARGNRQFQFGIGLWGNTVCAFQNVNGKNGRDNPTAVKSAQWLVAGQTHTVVVKVRKTGVEGYLDDKLITSWQTDFSDMSGNVALRHPNTIGFGSEGSVRLQSAEITEITGEGAAVGNNPINSAIEPIASTTRQTVDLLQNLGVSASVVRGKWSLDTRGLASNATVPDARIEFPYRPPAEYTYRAVFRRISGNDSVAMILVWNGRQFNLDLGAWNNTVAAFGLVNGRKGNDNDTTVKSDHWLVNGERYVLEAVITHNGVKAYLDGKLVTACNDTDVVSPYPWAALRHSDTLGLYCNESSVIFESVQVVEGASPLSVLSQSDTTSPHDSTSPPPGSGETVVKRDEPTTGVSRSSEAAVQAGIDSTVEPIVQAAGPKASWISLFEPAQLGGWLNIHSRAKLQRDEDGSVKVQDTAYTWGPHVKDVIIRADVHPLDGSSIGFSLRHGDGGYNDFHYAGQFNRRGFFVIGLLDAAGKWHVLARNNIDYRLPDTFNLQFSAIGDQLALTADGREVVRVQDSQFQSGSVAIYSDNGSAIFKNAQLQILDDSAKDLGTVSHTGDPAGTDNRKSP